MIDQSRQLILCVQASAGKTHDFALFKDSRLALAPSLELLADTGYLGINKLHSNSQTPHKNSKHHPLTCEQKQLFLRFGNRNYQQLFLERVMHFDVVPGRQSMI